MFTLRKITSQKVQMNFCLGASYTVLEKRESPQEFEKDFKVYFDGYPERDEDLKRVYAFVSGEDAEIYPLYDNQLNYIMTDSGKTFSNLSLK